MTDQKRDQVVTETHSRQERDCPTRRESLLTVSWPWVIGGFMALLLVLMTTFLSTAISQEHRLTAAEQQQIAMEKRFDTQQQAWIDATVRIEKKVDKIACDQQEFLKEFYKKIK